MAFLNPLCNSKHSNKFQYFSIHIELKRKHILPIQKVVFGPFNFDRVSYYEKISHMWSNRIQNIHCYRLKNSNMNRLLPDDMKIQVEASHWWILLLDIWHLPFLALYVMVSHKWSTIQHQLQLRKWDELYVYERAIVFSITGCKFYIRYGCKRSIGVATGIVKKKKKGKKTLERLAYLLYLSVTIKSFLFFFAFLSHWTFLFFRHLYSVFCVCISPESERLF